MSDFYQARCVLFVGKHTIQEEPLNWLCAPCSHLSLSVFHKEREKLGSLERWAFTILSILESHINSPLADDQHLMGFQSATRTAVSQNKRCTIAYCPWCPYNFPIIFCVLFCHNVVHTLLAGELFIILDFLASWCIYQCELLETRNFVFYLLP